MNSVYIVEYFAHGWVFFAACRNLKAVDACYAELREQWPGHGVRHQLKAVRTE